MGLILAILAIWSNLPRGFYIASLDVTYCTDARSCLHEQAHRIDYRDGEPSQSYAYWYAVQEHRLVAWECPTCRDEYSEITRDFPGIGSPYLQNTCPPFMVCDSGGWGGYRELYAEMWAQADGNINNLPPVFRPFYEVTNASKLD